MADTSSERYVLLNQLAEEFAARYRSGERPSLQEYCDRHPELADDIREIFPSLVEMERARDDVRVAEVASSPPPLVAAGRPAIPFCEAAGRPATPFDAAGRPATPFEQLGDFLILREIGHGGMGVVYEAEQVSLGRRVALKLLTQRLLRDANQRRRFEREAKSAARLHHTNIVPVFGSGEHQGIPYYVMQFIEGTGLGRGGRGGCPPRTGCSRSESRNPSRHVAAGRSATPLSGRAGSDRRPLPRHWRFRDVG